MHGYMSFKLHLIIVSFIIISVYLAWQMMNAPAPAPQAETQGATYHISVIHASWGVNCRLLANIENGKPAENPYAAATDENKLKVDNVLPVVSGLCNGKQSCDIPIDIQTLGDDPSPNCTIKMLEVEYRCFSYDRPRSEKIIGTMLSLHCNAPTAKAAPPTAR